MQKAGEEFAYTETSSADMLQRLGLEKALEQEVLDMLRAQDNKLQILADQWFEGNDCLKTEPDIVRLAVIVKCLEKTKADYARLNIEDAVFYDTMSDIRIWCENNGNRGLNNDRWLNAHIKGQLFRLGRLQYQLYTCDNQTLDYSRLPFNRGEHVIYIHIPQGEKLLYADCMASISRAKAFFKIHFPDYNYKFFFCESWLLFEGNAAFMKPDGNIMQFASLFDLSYSVLDDKQAIERIFGQSQQKAADYPERTTLQRAAKQYMLNGHKLGIGIGTIKAK